MNRSPQAPPASKPCPERDLVLAMVASRIVAPHYQAGHAALVAHHDAGRGLGRGILRRGRSLRGHGWLLGKGLHEGLLCGLGLHDSGAQGVRNEDRVTLKAALGLRLRRQLAT
jgi:hypothetical protein